MVEKLSDVKIKVRSSLKEIISAVKELEPEEKELFIENLLASTSPEYLESIKEAREDYRMGRVASHEKLFKKDSSK